MGAAHAPAKRPPKPPAPKAVLPIALILNGAQLAVRPAPFLNRGRLYVPARRILTALGLSFDIQNGRIVVRAGSRNIAIAGGIEIHNTLYVPLRFFTQALGAQATFNRQTNSVEIISLLVGSTGNGITMLDGGVQESGTLEAIDVNSAPQTITLTHNASVRTLQLRADATILVQDVNAGTTNPGTVQDLHPGDFAEVQLDKSGQVKHLVDAFGSRSGRVAGVGTGQIVLDDGHVVAPDRDTGITLNGAPVGLDAIAIGDEVMVRYNIDSSEVREIVATRPSSGTPPPPSAVAISSIDFAPAGPLRAGETLRVTLRGTPGAGVAHYDIGPYVRNLGLIETQPGTYTGTWAVPRGVNIANAPLLGHLSADGIDAPPAQSVKTLSVASQPPAIVDFAPGSGASVNNTRPAIYATFSSGTVPVSVPSEHIVVNGHDVTASAVRTPRAIEYIPGIDYPAGAVRVEVRVSDDAGNRAIKNWTFFVGKNAP